MVRTICTASLLAAASLWAQFSGSYSASTANTIFLGWAAGNFAGHHVVVLPDINDDGFDELAVTAPYWDLSDSSLDNGCVYFFYGRLDLFPSTIRLEDAEVRFFGTFSGNETSHDVYGVGDIDGDGYRDFAVAIKKTRPHQGGLRLGKVYLFFGGPQKRQGDISLEEADASLVGEAPGAEAAHVIGPGDLDGDGLDDVVVGAGFHPQIGTEAGKVYVFFGRPRDQWPKNAGMEATADASLLAESAGDWAGHRVAATGDVDGDGRGDFFVGAHRHVTAGVTAGGTVYLILGKPRYRWAKDVTLAQADASWYGDKAKLGLGWNVAGVGDADGDGLGDILLAGGFCENFFLSSKKLVLAPNQPISKSGATAINFGFRIGDDIGHDIHGVGDLNGDGLADFMVGTPLVDDASAGPAAGKAFLFYGRSMWPPLLPFSSADAQFSGEAAGDAFGFSVSGGDLNGDGTPEFVISAPRNDRAAVDAGAVYLFQKPPKPLTVVYPAGGETFFSGQTATVRWMPDPSIPFVDIDLSVNGGRSWRTTAARIVDSGSFHWKVPFASSSECLLRIRNADGGEPCAISAPFSIAIRTLVEILAPNGGEKWRIGSREAVLWKTSDGSGRITLALSRDGGESWDVLAQSIPDSGRFLWEVTAPVSVTAIVRVTDDSAAVSDVGNDFFSILEPPTLTILEPNGGETLTCGSVANIRWISNSSEPVTIALSRDAGQSWHTLVKECENTGIYPWLVEGPPSDHCLIRIRTADRTAEDQSDSLFSIVEAPQITLVEPRPGDTWRIGSRETVRWLSVNSSGAVTVRLSRNGGADWEALADSTADIGLFEWIVSGPPSPNCLVMISDVDGRAAAVLEGPFTVDHPTRTEQRESSALAYALLPAYPNPFNASTRLRFSLPQEDDIVLAIYSLEGRRVRLLLSGRFAAGVHVVSWDGCSDDGLPQAAGLYFCRLSASHFQQTIKIIWAK